jgi:hypothetical protein
MSKLLCFLGIYKWSNPYHVIVTADSYSYRQVCLRRFCPCWRIAPRKLWGPVHG